MPTWEEVERQARNYNHVNYDRVNVTQDWQMGTDGTLLFARTNPNETFEIYIDHPEINLAAVDELTGTIAAHTENPPGDTDGDDNLEAYHRGRRWTLTDDALHEAHAEGAGGTDGDVPLFAHEFTQTHNQETPANAGHNEDNNLTGQAREWIADEFTFDHNGAVTTTTGTTPLRAALRTPIRMTSSTAIFNEHVPAMHAAINYDAVASKVTLSEEFQEAIRECVQKILKEEGFILGKIPEKIDEKRLEEIIETHF